VKLADAFWIGDSNLIVLAGAAGSGKSFFLNSQDGVWSQVIYSIWYLSL